MVNHTCAESCTEPDVDGGFPDCPVFRIQHTLWHLRSELELLERELSDLFDLPEE